MRPNCPSPSSQLVLYCLLVNFEIEKKIVMTRVVSMLCFVIMALCLWIVSCCVFYVLFFHALMCPLICPVYFPMFFPVAPSVYCIVPFMFLCAPPLRYHTWPPPSSPVPRLFISVCVLSLCVPFTPCLVIVFVSLCLRPCSHSCAW